jgi:putative chitinase
VITQEQIQLVTGDADTWFIPLRDAMALNEIDGSPRIEMFLAQASHESGGFSRLVENLKYSPTGLLRTFPKYLTPAEAVEFAYDEERISNRVYADRLGNGPEHSGDGFRYRGRGLFQITGKGNYIAGGRAIGVNLEQLPELAAEPLYAALLAGWFWRSRDCNDLADADDFEAITRKINGGLNGLPDRLARLAKIQEALA